MPNVYKNFRCLLILFSLAYGAQAQGWLRPLPEDANDNHYTADVLALPNGAGCLMLGHTVNVHPQLLLFRYDADGQRAFRAVLDSGTTTFPRQIIRTADGNYTALASQAHASFDQTLLVHFNGQGQILWKKYWQLGGTPFTHYGLSKLANGNYFLNGADADSLHFYWFSPLGDFIEKQAHSSAADLTEVRPLVKIGADTVLELAQFLTYSKLTCFDAASKTLLWEQQISQNSPGRVRQICRLADGNIGVLITQSSNSPFNFKLRKMNPAGQILWEKTFPQGNVTLYSHALTGTADGGMAASIIVENFGFGGTPNHIFRFDANGNQLWERPLPPKSKNLIVTDLEEADDGSFYGSGILQLSQSSAFTEQLVFKSDSLGVVLSGHLAGRVAADDIEDCQVAPAEPGLGGWLLSVRKMDGSFEDFTLTDNEGKYEFQLDTGDFDLQLHVVSNYWEPCSNDTVSVTCVAGDTSVVDFSMQKAVECPLLEVDIATPFLRRCFENTYYVRYCNIGTAAADSAYVEVTLDDDFTLVSSQIPATPLGNHRFRFDLDSVPRGFCGQFTFVILLDCDSTVLGETHCVSAAIFPDEICVTNPAWSGALLQVEGSCDADSVRFRLKNIGTGGMATPLEYVIIEDDLIFREGNFQLPANDSMLFSAPRNGSTWRMTAEQEPNAPFPGSPTDAVEGCGVNALGLFSLQFVSQFGEDDDDPFHSRDCTENTGSFDPNDKQGFPQGYGTARFVEPGQEIEYMIRFQNTGTDTAFTVVVRDTLSDWLDIGTVRPGVSSHAYQFDILGSRVLKFTFPNILLPDSNVNEAASHGFLRFRVRPESTAPLGTEIHNSAAIFFDFNAPVITNLTLHTLGRDFVMSGTDDFFSSKTPLVKVSPNPTDGLQSLFLENLELLGGGQFRLFDALGGLVLSRSFSGNRVRLNAPDLPPGLYFFEISGLGRGKLMIRKDIF